MTIYNRPSADVPVWAESGDRVQPTNPEIQTGWPLSTVPPSRQRFNWILGFVAEAVRYVLQRGVSQWDADEDYPTGGRVEYAGATYKALVDSPTSAPGVVPGEWMRWGYSSNELLPRVDSILSKSVAGSVDVVLTADEADNGILSFTGALTGNINVVVPNVARRWVVRNATTGSFTLGVKTSSGAAVAVAQGTSVALFCDGANNIVSQSILATTPAQFNNSTAIATTAFVKTAGRQFSGINVISTTSAMAASLAGSLVILNGAGTTITLPAASALPAGASITLLGNANTITVQRAGSDQIFPDGAAITAFTINNGDQVTLVSNGSANWSVVEKLGALSASAVGMPFIGVGQSWQLVTRTSGVTYTNTTGKPIAVSYNINSNSATGSVTVSINGGAAIFFTNIGTLNGPVANAGFIIIPAGATYVFTETNVAARNVYELR